MFTAGRIDEYRRDAMKELIYENDDSLDTVNKALSEYREMESEVVLPQNTSVSGNSDTLFELKGPINLGETTPYFKMHQPPKKMKSN